MERIGGERVEIDFAPFRAVADLLYAGPWVAERYAAMGAFVENHRDAVNPVVRDIIAGARRYSAAEAYAAGYRLQELRRASEAAWSQADVLVLPTTGTIYTHQAVAEEPVKLNSNLGYYTNFVNLLDLAAVAVPAGFRANGLPFGISIIGPAFSDEGLLCLGERFETNVAAEAVSDPPGCISVAVLGAHLSGQPLNWQLTGRGARLLKICRTAPGYRLYALAGTSPAKPGLVRDEEFSGPGIEVEVWAMPEDQFGSFGAAIPPPLGIGSATLASGETVKCFITEPYGVRGAREITSFGGWRKFLAGPSLSDR
jgi:allophanate hydrolase